MTGALSTSLGISPRIGVVRWTLESGRLVTARELGSAGHRLGDAMGRARRARRIAQSAAYGGGFGIAGIGVLGVVGYGLVKAEALLARIMVGIPIDAPPEDDGVYGAAPGPPIELLVLGDSSAAGLGADGGDQTIGAILASGVSAFAGRRVRLTNVAVVGAESGDLGVQVANALDRVQHPDAAVISIGTNDVTHRIDKSIAVRHLQAAVRRLRDAGAEVVVGTCPDLGAVQPIGQPLRALARRWSRDLAAAQTVAVVEAGGRTVSLGDILGPEFEERPHELFSHDRFHPSAAGYARAAAVLLPTLCSALGLFNEDLMAGADHSRGERVAPVSRAATTAVRDPGTEVRPSQIAGQTRGPLGRWAVVLHRVRRPFPGGGDDAHTSTAGIDGQPVQAEQSAGS
jgi:lysophospholipase L1-like esterase